MIFLNHKDHEAHKGKTKEKAFLSALCALCGSKEGLL